jgi:hypothetical protein
MDTTINSGHPPAEQQEFDQQIPDFFRILLGENPPTGVLNICAKNKSGGGMQTFSFQTTDMDGIVKKIMELRDRADVYYETCLQSQLPAPGKRGDVKSKTAMTAIWIDIDVAGPGHASEAYPRTKEDALEFVMGLGASLVVDSGGGLHAYFLFDKPWVFVDEADRQKAQAAVQYPQKLIIEKGKEHGWIIDNTSDIARLLRVPGTYNHKTGEKREVKVIYFDNDLRYAPEDFEPPPVKEPEAYPVVRHVAAPPDNIQYPPSDAEKIITHCAFIRHCVEDAASLTEPEWFMFLSIMAQAEDGDRLSHLYSSPYPGYAVSETDKKIKHVLSVPPITCEKIQMNAQADAYCVRCPFRGHVKSPIQLGNNSQRAQLMIQGVSIALSAMDNHGVPFDDDNLRVLSVLRREQPSVYMQIRERFAKMGISVSSLETAMQNLNESDSPPYLVKNGIMYCRKHTKWGEKRVPLCNFTAAITEQIIKDDGLSRKIHYLIKGILAGGAPLPDVIVPADTFGGMSWVAENYGARAIVTAGQGAQDHIRAAIQYLSEDIADRSIYTHTGWRKIEGEWVYLTTSGALGASGLDESVEIELEGKLKHYSLPNLSPDYPNRDAVKASLKILEVAPKRITIPMLSGIFRAPLEEALSNDYTIFFAGQTGTFKSEVTALMLAHFGAGFNAKNLTAEWVSTANSIEKMAFRTKDAVNVIDDFFPGTSQIEANKMHATADRIIRGQGNKSGRARMNADGSLRETYVSRGLIVASGEDIPRGASLRARMYLIDMTKGDVNLGVLTQLQKMAADGIFASAMAGYIKWLAPKLDDLKLTAQRRKAELRDEVIKAANAHSRTPEIVAGLLYGLEQFLEYAVHVGVYTSAQALDLTNTAVKTLVESNRMLQEVLEADDPVKRFGDLLLTAFTTGAAHLEALKGGVPAKESNRWGWKTIAGPSGDETKPGGKLIGWVDGINLYMDPDAAFATVQEIASRTGSPITITPITLRKRLNERGILVKAGATGKLTKPMKINGSTRKVMHLLTTKMFEEEEDESVDEPQNTGETEDKGNGHKSIAEFIQNNVNLMFEKGQTKDPFSDDPFNDDLFSDDLI